MTDSRISSDADDSQLEPTVFVETTPQADLFNPVGMTFKPISAKYVKSQLMIDSIAVLVVGIAIAAVVFNSSNPYFWLAELIPLGLILWLLWLIPRQVRAWGYCEGEKNLFIRRGIMFKKMWAVPYGRMQYVDVKQGPVDRLFGIAHVSLKTASAQTDAMIPGLVREEADRIRQLLTQRGEALRAGL